MGLAFQPVGRLPCSDVTKTDSLCSPFSNGGKQRFLVVVFGSTRDFARQFSLDPFVFKVAGAGAQRMTCSAGSMPSLMNRRILLTNR